MTAADIYRSHVFCNAYCTSFFEKTIDKSASFDIIDTVPNELNIWGYSSAGRALEWHSRGQRFDPAYLHQNLLSRWFDQRLFYCRASIF